MTICACGCGETFEPTTVRNTRPQRFINGHKNRRLRKETVRELTEPRRLAIYAAIGNRCEQCGLSMDDQLARFGRRLEIHHRNHDHEDNTPGNHEVLCTACHNQHSLAVRDEVKKVATWRERYESGAIRMWATGLTKENDPRIAAMAEKKRGRAPWNKKYDDPKEKNRRYQERKRAESHAHEARP